MTQLTEHFSLEELTATSVRGVDNTPGPQELLNLGYTARGMELVRTLLNQAISINSGYRSPAVNKAVGSKAKKSQHMEGRAVDFICPKFGTPREIVEAIKASDIKYDQLILEFDSWVHISFVEENSRKEVLVIDNSGTRYYV